MRTIEPSNDSRQPSRKRLWLFLGGACALVVIILGVYVLFIRPQPLDTNPIESQIEASPDLVPNLPFAEIERVDCPDDITVDEGTLFQCTVFATDGESVTIDLVQDDGNGNVRIVGGR
ncbi:MAG: DUF4333 domain-containing protein [Actinomycetota bacterium]